MNRIDQIVQMPVTAKSRKRMILPSPKIGKKGENFKKFRAEF